jgi:NAD(P)-dependent dehydrogenase (short-subunit alcohol dehydrogenase family)
MGLASRLAPIEFGERDRAPRLQRWLGLVLSRLLDATIALSFDRTGFRVHALAFAPRDLAVDLSDKRCLVTGASSGIGYETALALAALGAEVSLLSRDSERGEAAAQRIREQTGNPNVGFERLDVSSLASVRAAARRLGKRPVDALVHGALVVPTARIETRDALELSWATHVVGPHLLTKLLLPALEKSADARVVWASSGGMYARRLSLDDPNWAARERYDGAVAYAETKRAQVVLAELWADALRGTTVRVNAMHPGWADTPALRWSRPGFYRAMRPRLRTPAEGADTAVWLAASPRARAHTGRLCFDRKPRRTHLLPWTRESEAQRERLWKLLEATVRP